MWCKCLVGGSQIDDEENRWILKIYTSYVVDRCACMYTWLTDWWPDLCSAWVSMFLHTCSVWCNLFKYCDAPSMIIDWLIDWLIDVPCLTITTTTTASSPDMRRHPQGNRLLRRGVRWMRWHGVLQPQRTHRRRLLHQEHPGQRRGVRLAPMRHQRWVSLLSDFRGRREGGGGEWKRQAQTAAAAASRRFHFSSFFLWIFFVVYDDNSYFLLLSSIYKYILYPTVVSGSAYIRLPSFLRPAHHVLRTFVRATWHVMCHGMAWHIYIIHTYMMSLILTPPQTGILFFSFLPLQAGLRGPRLPPPRHRMISAATVLRTVTTAARYDAITLFVVVAVVVIFLEGVRWWRTSLDKRERWWHNSTSVVVSGGLLLVAYSVP